MICEVDYSNLKGVYSSIQTGNVIDGKIVPNQK